MRMRRGVFGVGKIVLEIANKNFSTIQSGNNQNILRGFATKVDAYYPEDKELAREKFDSAYAATKLTPYKTRGGFPLLPYEIDGLVKQVRGSEDSARAISGGCPFTLYQQQYLVNQINNSKDASTVLASPRIDASFHEKLVNMIDNSEDASWALTYIRNSSAENQHKLKEKINNSKDACRVLMRYPLLVGDDVVSELINIIDDIEDVMRLLISYNSIYDHHLSDFYSDLMAKLPMDQSITLLNQKGEIFSETLHNHIEYLVDRMIIDGVGSKKIIDTSCRLKEAEFPLERLKECYDQHGVSGAVLSKSLEIMQRQGEMEYGVNYLVK